MTSLRPAASILGGGKEASSGEGGTKWVAVGNNKKKTTKNTKSGRNVAEGFRDAENYERDDKERDTFLPLSHSELSFLQMWM